MSKKISNSIYVFVFLIFLSATARAETFYAYLTGAQEVPPVSTNARGNARIVVNEAAMQITFTIVFNGLSGDITASHIHSPAGIGANAPVSIDFGATGGGTSGTIIGTRPITAAQIAQMRAYQSYVNVHTSNFGGGEIRGQLGVKRPVDFDGDGRTDFSVLRFPQKSAPAPVTYWNLNSTSGTNIGQMWGDAARDFPTPGDFDGDGKDDYSVYRDGTQASAQSEFWILRSADNIVNWYAWGLDGDLPVTRDYDGDGVTDVAVYRRAASVGAPAFWYIRQSSDGAARVVHWGTTAADINNPDIPAPGDYDGDGKYDIGIYRIGVQSLVSTFIILRSSDGAAVFQTTQNYGTTAFILPGDYDGDGKFDYALARRGISGVAPLTWEILQTSNGQIRTETFGISADVPAQGDYDGDAVTDIAVYRRGIPDAIPASFYVLRSFDDTAQIINWGLANDFPLAAFDGGIRMSSILNRYE